MAADKLTGWIGPKVTHQVQPSIPPQAKLTGPEMEELRLKFDLNADEIDSKIGPAPSDGKEYARKNGAWVEVTAGAGDMLKSTYDPNAVDDDAFDMANMVESATKKILTDTERTKLTGLTQKGITSISTHTTAFTVGASSSGNLFILDLATDQNVTINASSLGENFGELFFWVKNVGKPTFIASGVTLNDNFVPEQGNKVAMQGLNSQTDILVI